GGIHGPVLTTLTAATAAPLFAWLMGTMDSLTLTGRAIAGGVGRGRLLPGNLCVATHLIGTDLMPIPAESPWILALEDVGEEPYRVDRMLTHWRLSGLLHRVAGVALGQFSGVSEERASPSRWLSLWGDRLGDLGIPVVCDLAFGHGEDNPPLALASPAMLDGDRGCLQIWRHGD
ncbi:MAG: LD-carboxypeptidase, partial [Oscillatoriales cyanobacterium SM2_2_1]|nr:LD-carboxypeptidase [Oscillatoriales cyanobacterium SM2_2_1]